MDPLPENIDPVKFKRAVKGVGEISLDGTTISVLMELDGRKDFASVAKALKMEAAVLRKIIHELYGKELITTTGMVNQVIDEEFFSFLRRQLSKSVGPIAEILIEDEIEELGQDSAKIPSTQAAELVDLLARQIPREEKKMEFQKIMIEKIKSKGY
jgi:hypothetical protein